MRDLPPGLALGLVVFVVLVATLDDPGVTWDEQSPNFPAAKNQAQWFRRLLSQTDNFSAETIDEYWYTTSDHPSLPRSCAALSTILAGAYVDEIVAFRLPSALLFSILIASLFFWCRKYVGLGAAWVAPLCLVAMPRLFGHAHIFSLDVPMMCWWIWTLFAVAATLDGSRRAWRAALVFSLAFATKLHSVFLPPLVLLWLAWLLYIHCDIAQRKAILRRTLLVVAFAVVLVPLVYVASQPWLWHDTIPRIRERFFDYAHKTPIGLWYLGHRYFEDTPWHYPLVMTLFTVPAGILMLLLLGVGTGWRPPASASRPTKEALLRPLDRWLLMLLGMAVPMVLIILPLAQGYDGVRLFLPAFPCLAVLAGYGFQSLLGFVDRLTAPRRQKLLLIALVLIGVLVPPCMDIVRLHPCQLAYYNALCGGLRGAQRLGLETTYWCDALTKPFLEEINRTIPPGSKLRPLSMNWNLIGYWQERGVLRADIDWPPTGPYDFHLLQCRQGMFTTTEWGFYRRMKPLLVQERDGVPLFILYGPLPSQAG